MIYQDLTTGELSKLETNHINLKEGKIYVPGTRKSNNRTLKLQANQILPLQKYLDKICPGIITEPTEQLFAVEVKLGVVNCDTQFRFFIFVTLNLKI